MGPTSDTTQRFYISEISDSNYFLPSDAEERERLAFQNEVIIKIFDDKTILAPVVLKDGDFILDSGTGSGHWILSAIRNVPATIKFYGIDISPHIFPQQETLPPNAAFITSSITSLPSDWTNKFSLIHQRLMCAGLTSGQWKIALSEVYRTLAPGGWIQFLEPHWILLSPSEAIQNHKVFRAKNDLCFQNQIAINVIAFLEDWLQDAGFVNVKVLEKRDVPIGSWGGEVGIAGMKMIKNVLRSIKQPIIRAGGFGMVSAGEYDAAVDDLEQLCEATPATYYQMLIFVAQKPQP